MNTSSKAKFCQAQIELSFLILTCIEKISPKKQQQTNKTRKKTICGKRGRKR